MRPFATFVVLTFASWGIVQAEVLDASAPQPPAPPQAQLQNSRTNRAAPSRTPAGGVKPLSIPPSTPIVTIQGACTERQAHDACKTVITREDLERYDATAALGNSDASRGRAAIQYARALAFSNLAVQEGLDKSPALAKELDAQVKLLRMRFLANAYMQNLQRQATTIGEPEIQKYYDEHRDEYEQFQVRRLSVPISVPTEGGRPLERSAVKAEMEVLRTKALAGEDYEQLLKAAYEHLHIQATPPPVSVTTMRRDTVQGDEAKVFDQKPGEISPVLDLPASFAIMKLESKEPIPLETARPEIEAALRRDGMQGEVGKLAKKISVEFNLQYLDMTSQPDIFNLSAGSPMVNRARMRRMPGRR